MRRLLLRDAVLQSVLIGVIAALLLHITSGTRWAWDLSDEQQFTLSEPARLAAARLHQPLIATVWASSDLEAPYHDHERAIVDKLDELATWSSGWLRVRQLDPSSDPTIEEEATAAGVQPAKYRFRSRARSETRLVWLGVTLSYGQRQVSISPIATLETLEYELVRALHLVTQPADATPPSLGWVVAGGSPSLATYDTSHPLGQLRDQLRAQSSLEEVALGTETAIPEHIQALLVVGVQRPLSDRAVWQLDQHLMRGGGLAIFTSRVRPDWPKNVLVGVDTGLDPWLERMGVTLEPRALADRQHLDSLPLPVSTPRGTMLVDAAHPLLPTTDALSPRAPVVRRVDKVVAPFATPMRFTGDPSRIAATPWFTAESTATTVPIGAPLDLASWKNPLPDEVSASEAVLALGLEGTFQSGFADLPIPPVPSLGTPLPTDELVTAGVPARLAVVGSADVVANNPTLTLNIVDWLQQDDALMGIRARSSVAPALHLDDAGPLWRWKLAVVLPPLALLWLLGLLARRRSL